MDSVKWLRRIVVLGYGQEPTAAFLKAEWTALYNRTSSAGRRQHANRCGYPSIQMLKSATVRSQTGPDQTSHGQASGMGLRLERYRDHPERRFLSRWRQELGRGQTGSHTGTLSLGAFQELYLWTAPPGDHILLSRASDTGGNEQPVERDRTRKDYYELNWSTPLHCSVR